MVPRWSRSTILPLLLATSLLAQRPGPGTGPVNLATSGPLDGLGPIVDTAQAELFVLGLNAEMAQKRHVQQEQPSEGVSKLDIKAPSGAKREYEKGVALLLKKDLDGAVQRLSKALAIYPRFVAAHNSLGAAYMDLGQSDKARDEFEQASVLDDHLPNSFSNLCHAELVLKHYAAAEQAIRKASSISPLSLDLSATLIYAEVLNHNFQEAVATARQVHAGKHEGAAVIHFWAAAAWREQKNLPEMEAELKTFLLEDPKNAYAEKARQLIARIDEIRSHPHVVRIVKTQTESPEMEAAAQEERRQIAEAERMCVGCSNTETEEPAASLSSEPIRLGPEPLSRDSTGWVLRKNVDEVAVFFAATDHGKAVSDLSQQEIRLLDDHSPPAAVLDFRNEGELPLRLGLLIDTSASIKSRFSFELDAAAGFLQKVLVNKDDQAFVVGFSNTVLMAQDLTGDQGKIAHAIGELAPSGGTALWDAVTFASRRLANEPESQPVAKILVVISDGDDNSSQATLKQAIEATERDQVIVYTVSTAEATDAPYDPNVGDRALKVLAEQSGGSAFTPGTVRALKKSLAELQEVIRSRYLISYKPARFQLDGRYRSIDINAQKSGRKLRVYARKGYAANPE